jgi:hypothetical protein
LTRFETTYITNQRIKLRENQRNIESMYERIHLRADKNIISLWVKRREGSSDGLFPGVVENSRIHKERQEKPCVVS